MGNRAFRRLARCLAGAFIITLLCGCVMRLAYNTLDLWVPYYLADYVSLDSSQEQVFDAELDRALAIHRRQEMPKIHRLIYELQSDLDTPLSYSQVRGYHDKFTMVGQGAMALFAKPLGAMIKLLDDQQVAHMNGEMERYIAELRQERGSLSTKKKVNRRARALQKTARNWIGSLTDRQRALLKELAGYQVEMEPVFFAFWEQFVSDWRYLTKHRHQPGFDAKLSQLLQQLVALENGELQIELNFYLNRRFDVMRRLSRSLDDSQRRYLDRQLTAIRKEVAVLINQ